MNDSNIPNRRKFMKTAAVVGALSLAPGSIRAANKASNHIRVGVIGLSRGVAHVRRFAETSGVDVTYVCDVDEKRIARGTKALKAGNAKGVTDFRQILEDSEVDVLSIAAPNFWHAPAAILAMEAGKHVYVEKPGSHNMAEADMIVAASRKYDRRVQMGNQRRSYPYVREAMQRLHEGVIGKVLSAKTWYNNRRGSIGKGKPAKLPSGLNYELWEGPTPHKPYVDNLVHYNWHWRWHWGGGEMANNGIHSLDLARWGLGVDLPSRVTYNGGRYYHDDDQETPDTGEASFHFEDCMASWSGSSCDPRRDEDLPFCKFYGEKGSLVTKGGNDYLILDRDGKELEKKSGPGGEPAHFKNFVDAIRDKSVTLNSEIGDAQKSTKLCHLANIAYRTTGSLRCDPKTGGKLIDNPEGEKLWGRKYRKGWKPKI
jgi:predicted dehydrogenase